MITRKSGATFCGVVRLRVNDELCDNLSALYGRQKEGGKLYLNLSPDIQEQWEKDISGHITKADTNWPMIEDKAPAELG